MRRFSGLIAPVVAGLVMTSAAHAQISSVQVTGGNVQGVVEGDVGVFKGIPFAAPPVGPLRWNNPSPVVPWEGVKKTVSYAPACMQAVAMLTMTGAKPDISEDCLYLNVWTPAKSAKEKLPVMVWIYGGAFVAGTSGSAAYDGTNFAKQGVILVSIAYRVGPMGWLAHPDLSREQHGSSGNYGLKDQIAALKWVQDNIARFGGDPSNVTIFGESAGGISVGMLAQSPEAKGLFAKAISESGGNFAVPRDDGGPGQGTRTLAAAEAMGTGDIESLGVKTIAEARALPAAKIQEGVRGSNWPIYDGKLLPGDPWLLYAARMFNDTPILIGTNSDEGGLFMRQPVEPATFKANMRSTYGSAAGRVLSLYPAQDPEGARKSQGDMMREQVFAWPTWSWARKQVEFGSSPAYVYYFDHKTPQSPHGALHASEIQYVFGNLGNSAGPGAPPSDADRKMSRELMGYWVNFAKTGNPNGPGLPDWPQFKADAPKFMGLGDAVGAIDVPNRAQYDFWDDYYAGQRAKREIARDGEGSTRQQ